MRFSARVAGKIMEQSLILLLYVSLPRKSLKKGTLGHCRITLRLAPVRHKCMRISSEVELLQTAVTLQESNKI